MRLTNNKSPCEQIAELEQWLQDHPDADIEAVREVRRKLTELQNEQQLIK